MAQTNFVLGRERIDKRPVRNTRTQLNCFSTSIIESAKRHRGTIKKKKNESIMLHVLNYSSISKEQNFYINKERLAYQFYFTLVVA